MKVKKKFFCILQTWVNIYIYTCTAIPVNCPKLKDFLSTLQCENSTALTIKESSIPHAGKGVFLHQTVKKDQRLCGYPGHVKLRSGNDYSKDYTASINRTKYVIDAFQFKDHTDILYVIFFLFKNNFYMNNINYLIVLIQ